MSKIYDRKIEAMNVLVEISIGEYTHIARNILRKNEFQRRRVKGSNSVYSLLKKDILDGCTIPPIVVAVRSEALASTFQNEEVTNEQVEEYFRTEQLIILDGLQRTFTLVELVDEVSSSAPAFLSELLDRRLRVEMYVGLRKMNILYRMLTLNTGQTPMSVRHQIEILYSDYLEDGDHGIRLFRETDNRSPRSLGEFKFNEVVEGFLSYLDRDPLALTRSDILENIKDLESLSKEKSTDVFQDYIRTYTEFLHRIHNFAVGWEVDLESLFPGTDETDRGNKVFGRNVVEIFSRAQALSGFGSAAGRLVEKEVVRDFSEISHLIQESYFVGDVNEALDLLLRNLHQIQLSAKKIGNEQRFYFHYFFRELFNRNGDSYLRIDEALRTGFGAYRSFA